MKTYKYRGMTICPQQPDSFGCTWYAMDGERRLVADTLKGMKALIRDYTSEEEKQKRQDAAISAYMEDVKAQYSHQGLGALLHATRGMRS